MSTPKKQTFEEPLADGAEIGSESDQDTAAQDSSSVADGGDWQAEAAALEARLAQIRAAHGVEVQPMAVTVVPDILALNYRDGVLNAAMDAYRLTLQRGGNDAQAILDAISAAKQYKRINNLF